MNCKPGDLAVVIGGESTPEMIGHIVLVERPATNGEMLDGHMVRWDEGDTEPSWIVSATSDRGIPTRTNLALRFFRQRAIADRLLRPISGLPDTEDTDEREPIKEVA
jgi:hypothetical protein